MCDHEYKYWWERKGKHCPHDKYGKVKWEGKTYCIFHAPMEAEDKRPVDFWKALDELIIGFKSEKAKEWDFEGFVFLDTDKRFREYPFPEGVNINFRYAHFMGKADFKWTNFTGEAYFGGAQFKGKAYFGGVQFSGSAYFYYAQFTSEANFNKAQFTGEAYFHWAQFSKNVSFSSAIFLTAEGEDECRATFSRASFAKEANFINITSQIPMYFSYAQFQGGVGFVGATMSERVIFRSADFHSQVNFQSANITELDFTGTTFRVQPYLGDLGAASREVKVENLVGDVVMDFTRGYEDDQTFILYVEGGEIDGVFSVRAPLECIRLKGTTFRATMNITPKVVGEKPLFSAYEVNFLGDVSIDDIYLVEMVKCTIGGGFRIAESDLSQAWFRRMDLSLIDFANVSWTRILRRRSSLVVLPFRLIGKVFKKFGSRLSRIRILYRDTVGLYKEIIMGNMKTLKKIHIGPNLKEKDKDRNRRLEEMYRAVASAYEGRRRYGRAGHFKAGEFEVRRSHTNILERIILAMYRWISFYGEEVIKPLILLVLGLPLTTALVYLFFHNEIFNSGYNYRIVFDLWNYDKDWGVLWSIIKDWFNTIPLGYKFLSPTVTTISKKVASWVNLIGVFERMLAALFTSLFIFALRRKARR